MTTLQEEAVKAVVGVPVSGPYLSKAEAVEIIEAALPFLPVQGAVKKLEWDEDWCAKTPFGMYTVQENAEDTWSFTFYDYPYGIPEGEFGTLDEAKAAAQADFEARILSALEPSAARELALEEILREVDEVERKVWAWSGSAFLNNELEGAEDADCKTELYRELCGIGNTMHWLRTKICALSSPDHADAGKVEGDGWPTGEYEVDYEVICNGEWVAGSTDLNDAKHYAAVYSQDGKIEIVEARTYRRTIPSAPSEGAE